MSGARGVAAPVPRTGQCRHEWTQKKKTASDGTPEPKKEKSTANCRQTESNQPSVKETGNNHQPYQDPQTQCTQQDRGDARCGGTLFSLSSKQRTGPDGPDSAKSMEAQQSQFIDEGIEIPVSAQLQYTDEKVDITAESSEDSVNAAGTFQREAG